ncbi:MAG: NAD(P)/FAD-dependent oxidoreductase, partial [Chloroflexi bacterium]|nr:NAD(P)/FAD-dependent oxidoreductase [Chloroflexota bacterium]
DAVIVGGGPAGLSAAVYLGRFLRSTVVIDGGQGRSSGPQLNENYLGFPRGVKVSRLRELGRRQAERFGVEFVTGMINALTTNEGSFGVHGDCGEWNTRSLIISTGVTDVWPSFPNVGRYVGRSLFWCITCDGFRTRGKRTVLIGATDESVTTACQFLPYTRDLVFIAAGCADGQGIASDKLDLLREQGIEVVEADIEQARGSRGMVREVIAGGKTIKADLLFSLLGATPNSTLAAQAGVLRDEHGYIRIDREQRTNVPRVYGAGDVTGPYAHQIASAVHEGAQAAQAANYDLYADFQRDEG